MNLNHLDELLLFILIFFSFAGITAYYFMLKKQQTQFSYQVENAFFASFKQSLKPQSWQDMLGYSLLCLIIVFLIWNNFNDIGLKHSDSLLYIDELVCNANIIQIHINWQNRFVPFSMQEWSALFPIMGLTNCFYPILWLLVSVQFFITAYLLIHIIPFEKLALRLLGVSFIIINASFFIPFTNLVIPDRNTLFLITIFLYCLIQFYKTQKLPYLLIAFIATNIAMYYKEPIFLYLLGFAGTSLLLKLANQQTKLIDFFQKPLKLIKQYPIEFILIVQGLFFLFLYILFNVFIFQAEETYGANDTKYFIFLKEQAGHLALFPLIIIMVLAYISDYKNILTKHQFSFMLFMAGLLYFLAIVFLKLSNFYYYGIAELSIILAAYYYIKNLQWQNTFKWRVLAVFITTFILFDGVKSLQNLFVEIQKEQIIKYKILGFKQNLPLISNHINKIFHYSHYDGAYSVSNNFLMLKNMKAEPAFHLYSFQQCYQRDLEKQTDIMKCIQTNEWNSTDYDLTVLWRDSIPEAEWQRLDSQYGAQMEKITHFPAWLQVDEKHHIYIIKN